MIVYLHQVIGINPNNTRKISSSDRDGKVPPATNINLNFKVLDGSILENSSKLIGRLKTSFIIILRPIAVISYEILVPKQRTKYSLFIGSLNLLGKRKDNTKISYDNLPKLSGKIPINNLGLTT